MSAPDRRAKLDRNHPELSIRRQCAMLGVARSGVYRTRRVANDNDLDLMRRLDELYLRWPFLGSRRMVALLAAEGVQVNRKRVRRLMRLMGIVPLGPKPRTSKPAAGHKIYPYLLRDLAIERANQVWCADITCLPTYRSAGAFCIWWRSWTGTAVRCWPGGSRTRWVCVSASRRWRRPWRVSASRRSSTPTKGHSSPRRNSPAR
jgi:putative transposase